MTIKRHYTLNEKIERLRELLMEPDDALDWAKAFEPLSFEELRDLTRVLKEFSQGTHLPHPDS